MGPRIGTWRTLVAALITLAGALGSAHAASWHLHYARGEEALRERDWREAIEQLSLAIEKRDQPEREIPAGSQGVVNYHPYLQLGIAYFNHGQYAAAVEAFDIELDFGSIHGSGSDLRNLRTLRKLALDAERAGTETEEEKITRLVDSGLTEAEKLENEGRLDEAMQAVGRALGADGENSRALSMMERLRNRSAEEQRRIEDEDRRSRLVAEGRGLQASGDYERASSVFRQALALGPSEEIQRLLDESLSQLRIQVRSDADGETDRDRVAQGLAEAARLESKGQLDEALKTLEPVLAVEPENRTARSLQQELLDAQANAQRQRVEDTRVAEWLARGIDFLETGKFEEAAAALNRVMALDPENAEAGRHLQQAIGALHALDMAGVGGALRTLVPPTIALFNRTDLLSTSAETETATQDQDFEQVDSSRFQLAGMMFDDRAQLAVTYLMRRHADADFHPVGEEVLDGVNIGESFYRFSFSRGFDLDPGATLWQVRATDGDGLTGEMSHRVIYSRPWSRSPWLYASLLLVPVAAVGAYRLVRARRRKRLMARRFNPYMAGAPVLDANLFFGRERLMSRVLQSVHNNSLMLYGERRIGKTSFQHHLKRRLHDLDDPEYEFFPVYIDLQGTPQERFFATLGEETFDELSPRLEGHLERPDFDDGYGYRSLVRDLRRVLGVLRTQTSKRVKLTLQIDEVDELNNYDPRINQRLRSLFMKSFAEDLVAVVTGVRINKHWASEGSPWYNFFEEVEVKAFSRDDAEQLIRQPVNGVFQMEPGVVERILQETGLRPYLIQKLCVELIDHVHHENRSRIRVADVDAVGQGKEG